MFTFRLTNTGGNMLTKSLFEQALGIEKPWYIQDIKFDVAKKQLDIDLDFYKGSVFEYIDPATGEVGSYKAYDTELKTWRHLNFFEHHCYLHCRTPRVQLESGAVRTISPPWAGLNSGFTLLFEAFILELCTYMPVHAVSKIVAVNDGKLWRLLQQYIQRARAQADFSTLERLGIDETSRAKHHEYVTVFVDLEQGRSVFITPGKSSETLSAFVADLEQHRGQRDQIRQVSIDMSPAFIKGTREELPQADITFDPFHVVKIINTAVDNVRRQEVKEQDILKGYRYLFLKNYVHLTPKEKKSFDQLKLSHYRLQTWRAYHLRENFQKIYRAETLDAFERLLKKWYFWATHSRLEPIIDAAQTIKRHWDGIINWQRTQINNGILEGLNSVIQAVKARARGFRNVNYFITMAYLVTADLNFRSVNKYARTH